MKRLVSIFLTLCMCFSACVILTACNGGEEASESRSTTIWIDEHYYTAEWSYDATHHWYVCDDEGCTAVFDEAEHSWSEGTVTAQPTKEADGVKTFTCTVCGYAKTEPVSYVMDKAVANRVYSSMGNEELGILGIDLNKDGLFLSMATHDIDLSVNEKESIARFEYDESGKMTSVIFYLDKEISCPITEYDEKGRPTRIKEFTVFSYTQNGVIFTPDGINFITLDEYGRCVNFKNSYNEYALSLEGNVGKWNRVDESEEQFYVVEYENNTALVRLEEWDSADNYSYGCEYKYNEKGLPTEYRYVEDPAEGGYMVRYEYNGAEQLVKVGEYEILGDTETKENEDLYIYDSNGRLAEIKWLDGNGAQYGGELYTYDEKGNLIKKETNYHPEADTVKRVYEYTYDDNGRTTSQVTTEKYSDGTERKSEYKYEYNENGRKNTYIEYDAAGHKQSERITELYNDGTCKETVIRYENGVEVFREEMNFDKNGDLVE